MVGTELLSVSSDHEFITLPKWQFNIGNLSQVLNVKKDFDCIVHLAAETDHEYCDANPTQCYFINSIATGNLARLADDRGVHMVYLSTASIFDGKTCKPYTNKRFSARPDPINHYNASKWYGEHFVQQYKSNYILRAGWMFGGGKYIDKKFIQKMFIKLSRGDKEIKVCDDCIGSPTYSVDLVKCILKAVEKKIAPGIYHAVNPCGDGVSRYEVACKMIKYLGSDCKIIPCKIDDLKDEFPCKRTNYEVLETNFPELRSWDLALKDYINDKYRH